MNSIRNKLGVLFLTVLAFSITGCSTLKEITNENHRIEQLSKRDAAAALKEAVVYQKPFKLWKIGLISETDFKYGELIRITDHREVLEKGLFGAPLKIRVFYHDEWRSYGTVYFTEITKIVLFCSFVQCHIRLFGLDGGWILDIVSDDKPEKTDKLLSALLTLCPNVK